LLLVPAIRRLPPRWAGECAQGTLRNFGLLPFCENISNIHLTSLHELILSIVPMLTFDIGHSGLLFNNQLVVL